MKRPEPQTISLSRHDARHKRSGQCLIGMSFLLALLLIADISLGEFFVVGGVFAVGVALYLTSSS